jgi:hypothetical protein
MVINDGIMMVIPTGKVSQFSMVNLWLIIMVNL